MQVAINPKNDQAPPKSSSAFQQSNNGNHNPVAPRSSPRNDATVRESRPQRTRGQGRGAPPSGARAGAEPTTGGRPVATTLIGSPSFDGGAPHPAGAESSGPLEPAAAASFDPTLAPASTVTPGRSRAGHHRATSANHLLNFQPYSGSGRATVQPGRAGTVGRRGGQSGGKSRGQGSSRPQRYDRNQFLQANFRFLVSDAVDASRFRADPDLMFDWEDVVQVEMMSSAPVQCSISLDSPPICPQITPCGHVFSFASIMQHLMNHGGKALRCSAPCPLCFAPLVARELRLLRIRMVGSSSVGATQTFQLLKRGRDSILPEPVARPIPGPRGTSTGGSAPAPERAGLLGEGGGGTSAAPMGEGVTAAAPGVGSGAEGLLRNVFVKFATTGDAAPLWRQAAGELAAYAAEVTSEGGLEAALTAPFIYAALDSLATRARRWTERRAEGLSSRGLLLPPGAGPGTGPAEVARLGAEAEAVVKGMFTAATPGVAEASEPAVAAAAAAAVARMLQPVEQEDPFPALRPAQPPPPQQQQQQQQRRQREEPPQQAQPQQQASPPAPPSQLGAAAAQPQPPQQQQQQQRQSSDSYGGGEDAEVEEDAEDGEEQRRQQQEELMGGEFSFAAAFSDDEPIDGANNNTAAADHGPEAGQEGTAAAAMTAAGTSAAAGPEQEPQLATAAGGAAAATASEQLLGTSPNTAMMNAPNQRDEFFTYQASDGTWVFLHPLNLRCLLHHYGTYEACPSTLQAVVLELEDVVQSDTTRKRWRFLGHLPTTATFKLAEVCLTSLLPPESLAPFADELGSRERRRRRRVAETRRAALKEAADARAASAARQGPSVEELRAMPLPSASRAPPSSSSALAAASASLPAPAAAAASSALGGFSPTENSRELQMAIEASLMEDGGAGGGGQPGGVSSSSPPGNVGWAHLVKMGFAATGPTLGEARMGSSPPSGGGWGGLGSGASSGGAPSVPQAAAAHQPTGVWANKGAIAASVAGKPAASPAAGAGGGAWGAKPVAVAGPSRPAPVAVAAGGAGCAAASGGQNPVVPGGAEGAESSGKGKAKGKGTVLLTTAAQRRY